VSGRHRLVAVDQAPRLEAGSPGRTVCRCRCPGRSSFAMAHSIRAGLSVRCASAPDRIQLGQPGARSPVNVERPCLVQAVPGAGLRDMPPTRHLSRGSCAPRIC